MTFYDPAERLRSLFPGSHGEHTFTASDAVMTMVIARELLELQNTKDSLAVLNLYANWTVHPEIRGSRAGFHVLKSIAKTLVEGPDDEAVESEVSRCLSLTVLRTQLLTLFRENHVPTLVLDSVAGWEMFGGQFFKAIMNKRLRFPPNPEANHRSSDIFAEMRELAEGNPARMVDSIRLRDDLPGVKYKIHWVVEIADGRELTGLLKNLEKAEDFSYLSRRVARPPQQDAG